MKSVNPTFLHTGTKCKKYRQVLLKEGKVHGLASGRAQLLLLVLLFFFGLLYTVRRFLDGALLSLLAFALQTSLIFLLWT